MSLLRILAGVIVGILAGVGLVAIVSLGAAIIAVWQSIYPT